MGQVQRFCKASVKTESSCLDSLRYTHSLMEILEFLDKNPDDQSVLET